MSAAPIRLLLLEDNRADAELLQAALAEFAPGGFAITHVERLADALARIPTGQFDVLLSDLDLPDGTGLATVQAIAARAPALPLVVLTGMKDDDLGRAAIRHGAQDYLVKGETSGALIGRTLRYAIERKRFEIGPRAANAAPAGRVAERTAEFDAANAVLLANAAGYRQLFDANPQPMYMYDPDTLRFIAVNDAAVAHYGWSSEEFLAMTVADIRPAGEIQRLRDHIARVRREDIGEAGFWKHRKKDGTLIDVEITSHAIEFGGRPARVAFAHDVTERRRAEEALRESEARFRSLTEMSSDFYWESDVEHRFTVHIASAKSSQAWVSQRGTQIGQRRWEIPHLSPDEAGWQAHRAVLEAHLPFRDFVFSRRGVDGAERHFTVSGDPVFDASGAFEGYRGVGSDITERKWAEQALQDSERLLREAQLMAGLGSYVLDIPTGRWRGSAVLDDIFGIDDNYERSVAGWLSLIHPEWQERMSHYFADEVLGKHVRFDREYRIIRKTDGEARWVHGLGELEFDAQGRPSRMIGTIIDITERKRTEEALRESESRFRSLTEMSSDFYWETDAEHRFTQGNSAANLSVQSVWRTQIGKRRWETPYVSPDEAGWQAHRTVLDAHRPFREFELSRLGTDGTEHHLSVSGDPLFDASGAFKGYRGVGRDVTGRKRAEQALRAAEEQFRSLVEQSIAGAYIIQDGRFAYVNPRCAEIFGYDLPEQMIGRDVLSVVAEKDRDIVAEAMRRRMEGEGATLSYNFSGLRRDGSLVEVGVQGGRATHRGQPAVIGLMQDISEKKRAEEEIQRYVAQLETAFMSTVGVATTLSEMRDPYTAGHERRVAEIAVAIGVELGFDARRQEGLRVAGYLHDIGKITIPSEILSKPGRLSPIEFKLIQGHAQASYEVLKDVEFPWPVAQVALQHHERIDGSGYPQGLKGKEILLEARIMAVADVVEAMSSHRPYRPGLGIDAALTEIERGRGTSYDAVVADACLKLFREKGYAVPA